MARDDAHLPLAAAVQPGDVGLGQQAHPVGIAAKGLGARVCRLLEVTSVDHVQGRTQVQVETQGGQLPTQRLPHLRGIFLRPGGADRHRVGQLGKTLQELVLLTGVVFLGDTDVKRDVSWQVFILLILRLGGRWISYRLAFLPGKLLERFDERSGGACRVCAAEVVVGTAEHHTADVVILDQLCQRACWGDISPLKCDQEKLPYLLCRRHFIQ